MTTPEARPEAVAVTEEMVEAAARVFDPGIFHTIPHFVARIGMTLEQERASAKSRARAALEAAAHVRSAQDHGGEANEMIGEPRSGRAVKAVDVAEEAIFLLERIRELGSDAFTEDGYRDFAGHVAPSMARLATLLSDHPAPEPGVEAKRWRHLKRGTTYEEVGRALLQASTGPIGEAATLVIYRDGKTGRLWAREESEFEDGRFSAIPADGGRDGK